MNCELPPLIAQCVSTLDFRDGVLGRAVASTRIEMESVRIFFETSGERELLPPPRSIPAPVDASAEWCERIRPLAPHPPALTLFRSSCRSSPTPMALRKMASRCALAFVRILSSHYAEPISDFRVRHAL
ncbi:hypothetical protein MRX96_029246 [Rhipicephalus microplus]